MKKIFIMKSYLLIIIIGLLVSCSKNEAEEANYECVTLNCLFQKDAEFIITTEEEYIQMAKQIYVESYGSIYECADTTQAPIEFNDYILLGKYAEWDMNDQINKNIYEDKPLKRIIYNIEKRIIEGPDNNNIRYLTYAGMNWIKIPKPPADYEILIEYTEY